MSDTDNNVDMMAEAREAQWTAQTFMGNDVIKALAPAKVNLFLDVGKRLDSGYHEVVTVMHALALHDILYFTCEELEEDTPGNSEVSRVLAGLEGSTALAGPERNIAVEIEIVDKCHISAAGFHEISAFSANGIEVGENLIFKAIDSLARKCGMDRPQKIRVRAEKHIPMQAGLGGGSADAAATLKVMETLWEGKVTDKAVSQLAMDLGADVTFFLSGGCALYDGLGDNLVHGLAPMKEPVVLVRPDAGVQTAQAYKAFDEMGSGAPADLLSRAINATDAQDVPLFNNLQSPSCSLLPEIEEVLEWLKGEMASDADGVANRILMSGSGSCVFAIVDTYAEASAIAAEAAKRGWWSRATAFSSIRSCAL